MCGLYGIMVAEDQTERWLEYSEQVNAARERQRAAKGRVAKATAALQAALRGKAVGDQDASEQAGDANAP